MYVLPFFDREMKKKKVFPNEPGNFGWQGSFISSSPTADSFRQRGWRHAHCHGSVLGMLLTAIQPLSPRHGPLCVGTVGVLFAVT